ncbi:two-component sensor histidine kinase [Rhodococcoides fascians]|uniref:HAMP domain-containing sensor histidine kinase n=1 Tax=Rhodococcoides fascians TaxID=1828 RepID=UPI000B9BB9EB|nr:ATP-binding protein [Rhodococcus fascians]OZE86437.1 two-component sensor histidine kinase [Rhodococcus fascians]OZF13381.1 two-component sensor histidine kinase [Rhodococcus fascians]OZF15928.1 two-component sensor histidine kinase [Rhodococcus fascians]OZF62597.1 two-component sensor histidine kinase [Rhodococcus fascians]OZF66360.1 two-component sensor histidine kinase [Rhodococcus fascians]
MRAISISVATLRPRSWTVRVRSAVASTVVLAVCLIVAGGALIGILYSSLESSARTAAGARAVQVSEQLETDLPAQVDESSLATDGQIGVVQVIDAAGAVTASSRADGGRPLSTVEVAPSTTQDLGRIEQGDDGDFWVTARGAETAAGPVTVLVGADREPVEQVVSTVAVLLGIVGPVVVALVALATYRLVGAALSPVERIRTRVASISNSDLGERIPVPQSRDEIARLAVTMNRMLERLQAGQRAQQRFVSDASHELRSPLSTISAALELAAARPELIDASLIDESLLPEARRMRRLIEDLLLLARSDEKQVPLDAIDVDLDDVMYEEGKRIEAITDLTVDTFIVPVRVTGDQPALARMVRNVVDNAARHAATRIELSCTQSDGFAVIVIDDDGPGIPEQQRQRVFDRFVRLDASRTRGEGGAGLGLAIVAGTVAAHTGSVTVSRSPLGGARFEMRIPMHSPTAREHT